MTNEQAAVLQHLRRTSSSGERCCVWFRRELSGDYMELVHVMCGPSVAQVDLFRADMKRLVRLARWQQVKLLVQALLLGLALSEGGVGWLDGVLALSIAMAMAGHHYSSDLRVSVTKGMWRRTRDQLMGEP